MKKIFLVVSLFLVVFLTGCSPKFTYIIDDETITEQVEVSLTGEYDDSRISANASYYGFGERDNYELTILRENNFINVKSVSPKKPISSFMASDRSYINRCFDSTGYKKDKSNGKITIDTSKGFNCMYYEYLEIDSIDVVIKTRNKVYENNADEKKFDTYIWHFDKKNADSKNIKIVVGISSNMWYYKYKFLIFGLLLVGVVIVFIYLLKTMFTLSSKKANRI